MASTINLQIFLSMWPIPIIFGLVFLTTLVVSNFGAKLFGVSEYHKRFMTFTMMFSNNNSLPICLIQSIAVSAVYQELRWDAKDTMQEIEARGISYIVIYSAITNFVRWSYGLNLLKNGPPAPEADVTDSSLEQGSSTQATENTPLINNNKPSTSTSVESTSDSSIKSTGLFANAFNKVASMFNPPLLAIFSALIVGFIPPLKNSLYGQSPVLDSLADAIKLCGQASIPLILICLGSQIYQLSKGDSTHNHTVVYYVIFSRFVLTPIIVISALLLVRPYFALGDDPVFVLVMMILIACPTAINLMQICQTIGKYENDLAVLLFYSYILAIPILTTLVTLFLFIIQVIPF
jgi:predicted permease